MGRGRLLACLTVIGVALTAVSLAWACGPNRAISLSDFSGPAGSSLTATGSGWIPAPVTIRWGSSDGPAVASAMPDVHGHFSTSFKVPSVAPGTYLVVATAQGDDYPAAVSFTVTPTRISKPPPASYPKPPVAGGGTRAGGRTITGTSRADVLVGSPYADVIECGAGDDRVRGGAGDDVIRCGAGRDRVSGGPGDDRIAGGRGNDRLSGGSGNDRLFGGSGNDRLVGGTGLDRLFGNRGRDVLFRDRRDRLSGGPGRDRSLDVGLAATVPGDVRW